MNGNFVLMWTNVKYCILVLISIIDNIDLGETLSLFLMLRETLAWYFD